MKRWLAVVALLFGGVFSLVRADYAILIVNLGGSGGDPNAPAVPGAPPVGPRPIEPSPRGPGMIRPGGPGMAYPGGPGAGPRPMLYPTPGSLTGTTGKNPVDEEDDPPLFVAALVEVIKSETANFPLFNAKLDRIIHKWGKTALTGGADLAYILKKDIIAVPKRFKAALANINKQRAALSPDKLAEQFLDLAEWALLHGLYKEVPTMMDEAAKAKPTTERSLKMLKNFADVQANLARPVTQKDDAEVWRDKLGCKLTRSEHYALLYDTQAHEPPDIVLRRERLEQSFANFYWWFAFRGKLLPVPDKRLVAVLIDLPDEFRRRHVAFDSLPMEADAFFVQRDNLVVYSSKPLDEGYDALSKITKPLWQQGWNQAELLKGEGWGRTKSPPDVARNQMLALIIKSLQEDAVVSSISHENVRQLVAVSGLLPGNVTAPEWVRFGLASFFETPRYAPWEGVGAPHWTYLREYKDRELKKKLDVPLTALEKVVTDKYFREAEGSVHKTAGLLKARTMAWSLTFYLANKQLDGLLRYHQELSRMPRDLPFDDRVLLNAFARAFELTDANGIDQVKMQNFAKDWHQYIYYTNLEVPLNLKEMLQKLADDAKPSPRTP